MKTTLMLFALSLLLHTASAQAPLNLDGGVALAGYDAVAYRDQQRAVKGDRHFAAQHGGATYHFASETNKEKFVTNPEAYVPAYGGWCAYAMGATGERVSVDPKTFKVIDGRTYLFYNALFTNTLPKWNADEAALKAKADANWRKQMGR